MPTDTVRQPGAHSGLQASTLGRGAKRLPVNKLCRTCDTKAFAFDVFDQKLKPQRTFAVSLGPVHTTDERTMNNKQRTGLTNNFCSLRTAFGCFRTEFGRSRCRICS